jgi:hypothetical protein
MKDMQAHLEKLRCDAELAADGRKKELFARLAEHLTTMASEIERGIAAKLAGET